MSAFAWGPGFDPVRSGSGHKFISFSVHKISVLARYLEDLPSHTSCTGKYDKTLVLRASSLRSCDTGPLNEGGKGIYVESTCVCAPNSALFTYVANR